MFEQYQQKLKLGAAGACPELIEKSFSIAGVEKIFASSKAGDLIARRAIANITSLTPR